MALPASAEPQSGIYRRRISYQRAAVPADGPPKYRKRLLMPALNLRTLPAGRERLRSARTRGGDEAGGGRGITRSARARRDLVAQASQVSGDVAQLAAGGAHVSRSRQARAIARGAPRAGRGGGGGGRGPGAGYQFHARSATRPGAPRPGSPIRPGAGARGAGALPATCAASTSSRRRADNRLQRQMMQLRRRRRACCGHLRRHKPSTASETTTPSCSADGTRVVTPSSVAAAVIIRGG